MAIIALDTATPTLALALGDEQGNVVVSQSLRMQRVHATMLHPLLDGMMEAAGVKPGDVRGVAVGLGPGSYTGVRIGVATAKMIGYQLGVPVAGVSSLRAAAYAARASGIAAAVFDARRGDAYAGAYEWRDGVWETVLEERRVACAAFARELATLGASHIALTGDAADAVLRELAPAGTPCTVYDRAAQVRAEHVYDLALPELARRLAGGEEGGHGKDAHALVPRYLQLAEAEARWRAGD